MKITTAMNPAYAVRRAAAPATVSAQPAPNFRSMTRHEMQTWVNNEIRSGRMTLDEGAPLFLMTMKLPVGATSEVPAIGDPERIDFIQRAQLGLEGARQRNDKDAVHLLEDTLKLMLRYQR